MKEKVGFGPRLKAYLVDSVILSVIAVLFTLVAKPLLRHLLPLTDEEIALMTGYDIQLPFYIYWYVAFTLLGVFYGLIEVFKAQSPGKILLKLKIQTAEAMDADTKTLVTRYAVKNISQIVLFFAFIFGSSGLETFGKVLGFGIFVGCLLVLGKNKLAFQDMAAKTAIFSTNEAAAQSESAVETEAKSA